MDKWDSLQRSVFALGLAQTVLPVLEKSSEYGFAGQVLDMCWQWVEQRNVDRRVLFFLYHDEDDTGVEPIMSAEQDPRIWGAWGCVGLALIYTAYCAYTINGEQSVPETLESAESGELFDEFTKCYEMAGGEASLPGLFSPFVDTPPEGQYTRQGVTATVSCLLTQTHKE